MSLQPNALPMAFACVLSLLPLAALADQWQDIQQRKELRCGTFADVPPFAAPDSRLRPSTPRRG